MFNTVVCAIGMGSRERVHHLIDTSRELLAPGGALHFVHAVDRFPSLSAASPDAWATSVIAEAERKLCDLARPLPVSPAIHVRVGRPDEVILAVASEVGADLILVAAHREDILDKIFGSTVDHIAHHARCSVHIDRIGPQKRQGTDTHTPR
ncbi:universal stress protein [Rhizobium mesosinicum]|uniref:Universal stress protein n=1 Tax=Rhizobium mesosinicum TaxID=335017 RepID=A0ABS7GQX3_9HYPH|nr:universal stress protein [Rhizobium mesosinicum]MBW9052342.1 universal stress protein [Rhizobium mesosinicum]